MLTSARMSKKIMGVSRLQIERKRKGVTLKQMADDLFISISMLSRIERKKVKLRDMELARKIADYLDVSMDYIFPRWQLAKLLGEESNE